MTSTTSSRGAFGPAAWLAAWLMAALCVSGGTAADNAREIVAEAQRRVESKSQRYEGTLQVVGAGSRILVKRWTFERLGSHGQSKVKVRFTAPAEVEGVALLIVNHPDRSSDQWMWTPALQRERRIALQDRSARFFGTDFSFEDLEERDVQQYEHRLIGEEMLDGAACWRIESRPSKGKVSQYSRSESWIRKDSYSFVRIDNFGRDELVRRLVYRDFENVQNIRTARQIEVTDFGRKSRTILQLDKLQYNQPMQESDFRLQALQRE
jgi:hypothetical protein